ncbi:hypothetical protein [Pelagimonas varians]|uniref:Uncharacterized protein n=1 Tax=Pelagimonas varians TaxID=696760 RepID=A0A238KCQ5_9RHOB|nr:hypothetical protein [Pelagimonas varians]PYG29969.1 hypothetical protein C8N36_107135 [Pelagimonas varians]SMX40613.1 hypothetical protein PEV8663_02060 [Pelagimonas varians]
MKVRFHEDHDWRVTPAVVKAFRKGATEDLPKVKALALIKDGIAVDPTKPLKQES